MYTTRVDAAYHLVGGVRFVGIDGEQFGALWFKRLVQPLEPLGVPFRHRTFETEKGENGHLVGRITGLNSMALPFQI